jgi:hypothetical protein
MKVIIPKAELIKQRKTLKIARLSKILKSSAVTLTASDSFSIAGQGFMNKMECEALRWGTVTLPFAIWQGLIKVLGEISSDKISIEAENGKIRFQTIEINHPNIRVKVSSLDKLAQEIPLNATHTQIIEIALSQRIEFERLKASVIWNVVKENIKIIRLQLKNAAFALKEYGVIPEDLIEPLARRLGINNREAFLKMVFYDDLD